MKSFESGGVYGKLSETEPLIEKYKPSYFSRGGEHLVYKVPEHPGVVIKASAHKITNILSKYYEHGDPDSDTLKEAVKDEFSKEVAEKNAEVRELREVFGRDHVLNEKRYLMQVPVSREIVEELYREDYFKREVPATIANTQDVWTHVIVQSFTPEAANPERQSFSFGSLVESGSPDKELYDEVTRTTVAGIQLEGFEDKLLPLQDSSKEKSLSHLLAMCKIDSGLRDQVADFIKKSIEYTSKTGQILALAGKDNVFFYKKDETWSYLLLDAIPIPEEKIFRFAEELEAKIDEGRLLSPRETHLLVRALNYVRVINGTAAVLGVEERLELPAIFSQVQLLPLLSKEEWKPGDYE